MFVKQQRKRSPYRISLRDSGVEELADDPVFDLVHLPILFLSAEHARFGLRRVQVGRLGGAPSAGCFGLRAPPGRPAAVLRGPFVLACAATTGGATSERCWQQAAPPASCPAAARQDERPARPNARVSTKIPTNQFSTVSGDCHSTRPGPARYVGTSGLKPAASRSQPRRIITKPQLTTDPRIEVLALWLGLRSQVRQGRIHARAMAELVEALRADENEDRQLHDGSGLRPPVTGGWDDQGEHG